MIKRTIEISSGPSHLSVREEQLVVKQDGQEIGRIPCEVIGLLVLDSMAATYTHSSLVCPLTCDTIIVVCGDNHHPVGMVIPIASNTLQAERLRTQVEASKPLAKRIWKQIVQAKIRNQAQNVANNAVAAQKLRALVSRVRSGDSSNVEAQAGRIYWPALFRDKDFRRRREGHPPNNLLNYGYMALRAATARAICGGGLHPSIGLHHHNRYNPFCLADDLMEPYRRWVDVRVRELHRRGETEINKHTKAELLEVLTDTVTTSGDKGPLMVALSKTVASLCACYAGNATELTLPYR